MRADGFGLDRDELRIAMSLRAQQWMDVLDQGDVHYAFEMARDENDADSYGFTILARVEAVGPIMAACEDVADALGGLDYDEAILAVWATVDQWKAVANAIDPTNRLAFQVRFAAHALRYELENADFDLEALADLVTLASLEAELINTALRWMQASEERTEEQFWPDHEVRLRQVLSMSRSLKADLRERGELGLDDELLLGKREAEAEQARRPGGAPALAQDLAARATIIAMGVRNAMEGTVHGGELGEVSLSDEQMATLNPIIRNAIATALHAEKHYFTEQAARAYVDFQAQLVPSYWEPAELLEDYTDLWPRYAAEDQAPEQVCRRCGRTIVNLGLDGHDRWTHVAADGGLNVGCRAASFERDAGWNDALPRTWKAAPN